MAQGRGTRFVCENPSYGYLYPLNVAADGAIAQHALEDVTRACGFATVSGYLEALTRERATILTRLLARDAEGPP